MQQTLPALVLISKINWKKRYTIKLQFKNINTNKIAQLNEILITELILYWKNIYLHVILGKYLLVCWYCTLVSNYQHQVLFSREKVLFLSKGNNTVILYPCILARKRMHNMLSHIPNSINKFYTET